jgi:acetoacetyl-CoA reductase
VDLVSDDLPPLDDIDVLVSNAGLPTIVGGAHSMDLEKWQRDLSVNLTGSFRVIQPCLRGMRDRRYGRIVVVSSFAARFGMPAQVAYSASKAGLLGMVKTIAAENAALGVTANAILPGLVASDGVKAMPPEIIRAWLERIPSGRLVETSEIAAAAAYFASAEAGSVTGQELVIDGGLTLNTLSVTSSVVRDHPRRAEP